MSNMYKSPTQVPVEVIVNRLVDLSHAIQRKKIKGEEVTMSYPPQHDKDTDIIVDEAARRLTHHAEHIPLTQDQFNMLTLCSFRYALGRMTYMVSDVADFLEERIQRINLLLLEQMMEDIDRAIEQGRAGHECDEVSWIKLKVAAKQELKRRETNVPKLSYNKRL